MDLNIDWSKLKLVIKMIGFWTNINSWNICPSMVLEWWFCNKFAWVVFFCLDTKACIPHHLILDERFMIFDKYPLGIFKCGHTKKVEWFCTNGYLSQGWLSWSMLRLYHSYSDVNVIEDHINLVEEKHPFQLDPFLLNFEVCSFTFFHLNVSTQLAENLKMQWQLIKDKMLLSSLKKMRFKCLIEVVIFVEGVFLSWMVVVTKLEVVRDATFIRLKVPTRSTKTVLEETK